MSLSEASSPFALFLALGLFAAAVPVSGAPAYVHDPFIAKQGGTYYLFGTGAGIPIQRSTDLVEWKFVANALVEIPRWCYTEVPGFNGSLWAPDVSLVNGRWYLYYSVSTFGSNRSCIGLAVNKTLDPESPDYEWVDQGKVVESQRSDNFNAIDANLSTDGTGKYYLTFGSFWGGIKMVEVDPATGKPREENPLFISLAARPEVAGHPIEGPYILRQGDWFYLFVSFDFCCRGIRSDYKIAVGRSKSITGPYADRDGKAMTEGGGTIVLAGYDDVHGPGHNMVLRDGEKLFLVHHEYDGTRGGQAILQVRPLTWTADGWPVAGDPLK